MNYYYEIKLNFNDVGYAFYEWNETDKFDYIKKIPLIKVKSNTLKKIITNNFRINRSFLDTITKPNAFSTAL